MPPPLLLDLGRVDLQHVHLNRKQVYELIPHRYEFMLLDGVCMVDKAAKLLVAFSDVQPEAWWVRGHIPGRPLLPGAVMLEMAAQTAALGTKFLTDLTGFVAFGGVDACKFRETVVPPARLYHICVLDEYRSRRIVSSSQGVLDGRLVFEAKITGLVLP